MVVVVVVVVVAVGWVEDWRHTPLLRQNAARP